VVLHVNEYTILTQAKPDACFVVVAMDSSAELENCHFCLAMQIRLVANLPSAKRRKQMSCSFNFKNNLLSIEIIQVVGTESREKQLAARSTAQKFDLSNRARHQD
jgi:hypothetical protein